MFLNIFPEIVSCNSFWRAVSVLTACCVLGWSHLTFIRPRLTPRCHVWLGRTHGKALEKQYHLLGQRHPRLALMEQLRGLWKVRHFPEGTVLCGSSSLKWQKSHIRSPTDLTWKAMAAIWICRFVFATVMVWMRMDPAGPGLFCSWWDYLEKMSGWPC